MRFSIRFTEEARDDLARLYDELLQLVGGDFAVAERALQAIRDGIVILQFAPLSCRKVSSSDPFLRELVLGIAFSGYVLLYEVEDIYTATVLAARHQREDDLG
ncbi:type II toxin-antitoxin system RelE/ParE family toxin [Xanthomonas campestris pv. raphani]|uniref:type II toxin-antitoxin system RelE/ParE family toxin n=1 Tax=Xanthomonas campestris TaxID=339 RepID=UPI002B2331D3|nr:type II toxin-antitoxin system RelE/ParE family toxin [Xanthomonas campestris]MEA9750762.1 type II toxin-antitoxin system RelE/ParE family toxin [Xanthomonas campestris pv. raphani]MEA9813036.1 type II toxin-antitoxin system RelE/ParE family toxin [Xanthomonas campestris pv. raphani]MEA9914317.1 type II toxin-antitoxin system RelE/ParE family toxin [Xanthomonas campestris pv. raphani]